MLSEYGQNKNYIRAAVSKGECFSGESLYTLLVLQQQKMINELIVKVYECKKLQKGSTDLSTQT
jgi:hypothetical protein